MTLESGKLLRYLLFLVAVIATIYFLMQVREVLVNFALGAVLAYLLYRPVIAVEKQGVKRVWAILLIYIVAIVIIFLLLTFAVPGIVRELRDIADVLPRYADQAQDVARKIDEIPVPGQLGEIWDENVNQVKNYIFKGVKNFVDSLFSFFGMIFALIFSPILAFYIINDWEKIKDGFLGSLSPRLKREVTVVFNDIDQVLIEFLKGHLLVAVLVGTLIGTSAGFLGVKFPLLIGLISAVTNLIPFFGPIIGGIPAIAIALSQSIKLAIYMGIAIIIVQQLEGNIITPRIIGDRLGLHPLIIVFSLLAGGELFGIWGMLFAVPAAAVLKVLVGWAFLKAVNK